MIKINEQFSLNSDMHCWHLHESYEGVDKNGNIKMHKRITYHPNLKQVTNAIIEKSVKRCESIEEIKELLKNPVAILLPKVEQIVETS